MTKDPLISIIIPVYNREMLILDTLKSAQNQTYKNIEIIIGDNCSTDNTYCIVEKESRKDNRIKLFKNKRNLGPVRNWCECLKRAKGEYIKILWSDDLISDDFIQKTLPIMIENKDIAFVYTKVKIFGDIQSYNYNIGNSGKYEKDYFIINTIKQNGSLPVSPGCAIFRAKDLVIDTNIINKRGIDHTKTAIGIDTLIYLYSLEKYNYFYYLNKKV